MRSVPKHFYYSCRVWVAEKRSRECSADSTSTGSESIYVRRAKREGFTIPLSKGLGAAIRRYIEIARPRCSCPSCFLDA